MWNRGHFLTDGHTNDIGRKLNSSNDLPEFIISRYQEIVTHEQLPQTETDPHRLAQRQKQVNYGKNTVGYQNYITAVPKSMRYNHKHPTTPDITITVSKRQWNGMVSAWRRKLHEWDTHEGIEPIMLAPASNTSTCKQDRTTEVQSQQEQQFLTPPKPLHIHSCSASDKKRAFDAAFNAAQTQSCTSSETGQLVNSLPDMVEEDYIEVNSPPSSGSALGRSKSRSMTVSPVEGAGGGLPRAGSARSLGAGSSDWEKGVEVAPAGSDEDDDVWWGC